MLKKTLKLKLPTNSKLGIFLFRQTDIKLKTL